MKAKVAVLMGGDSSEREVSLRSGAGVSKALAKAGYEVVAIDVSWRWGKRKEHETLSGARPHKNDFVLCEGLLVDACTPMELAEKLLEYGVQVVFIALHGGYGEDGTIQAFLELMRIPHTSPPAKACMLAMDKRLTKQLLISTGLPTAEHIVVNKKDFVTTSIDEISKRIKDSFGFPCAVKPSSEGSTIGVSKVESEKGLKSALETAFKYGEWSIIEKWIEGVEVTCPVLGEGENAFALPLIEIVPKTASGFYDYGAKYTPGMSDHIIPPRLPKEVQEKARDIAIQVHRLLGCSGFTRTDMVIDKKGNVYVLELNAVPGMTETSLVPHAAEAYGWEFTYLVDWIVQEALRYWGEKER
ncbi:MAG: hypothetical protein RUDDFDWM_001100 [Candidatus Fervidibacterota bacterium]